MDTCDAEKLQPTHCASTFYGKCCTKMLGKDAEVSMLPFAPLVGSFAPEKISTSES